MAAWIWTLGLALLAGLIAWGVGESLHDDYKGKTTGIPNRFDSTIQDIAKQGADRNNARLSHGIFGAFVGLLGGLTGGLDRRSATRAVSAGRVGIAKGRIEISKDFRLGPVSTHEGRSRSHAAPQLWRSASGYLP
jgi:hypothetical protein